MAVTPYNAGGIVAATSSSSNTTVYYPQAAVAGSIFLDPGLHRFDEAASGTTPSDDMLKFRITASNLSVPPDNTSWVLMVRPTVAGSSTASVAQIVLISPDNSSRLPTSGTIKAVQLLPAKQGATTISAEIGVYPKDVCSGVSGATGCNAASVNTAVALPLTFVLAQVKTVGVTVAESDLQSATPSASTALNIQYATTTLTAVTASNCPAMDDIYKPSNKKIDVFGSHFASLATTTGTAPLASLLVVAKSGTSDATVTSSYTSANSLYGTIPWGTDGSVSGFTNTSSTAVSDASTQYQVRFMVRDAAGYISPFNTGAGGCVPGATGATQRTNCCLVSVRTADIDQFLKTGKCFIATAVFHDENAAPVRLLREFRNQILSRFDLGISFIRFYYAHSPRAAEWLNRHGYLRPIVGLALVPIILLALMLLHPISALVLLASTTLAIRLLKSRRRALQAATVGFLLVSIAILGSAISARAAETLGSQPYIDQLKRTMPQNDEPKYEPNESDVQPYINHLKQNPAKKDGVSSDDYTERLRRTDPDRMKEDQSVNYTERARAKLNKDPDADKSAIQSVLDGKSDLKQKKVGTVNEAAGVRVGAAMTHDIKNSKRISNADIEDFYGSGYHPDVTLFYEFQPLKTSYFGTFGLGASVGIVYFTKRARFDVNLTNPVTNAAFGAESDVRLKFYAMPITPYASYRLHVLKYLVPYVQGGPSAILYTERRSDESKSRKGYSTGYSAGGGVMILLDWIFPRTTWELYSSSGPHHLYLTADYYRTEALSGDVRFSMYGATGGLTYEF